MDKEQRRQRDEAATQWRALLRREIPMLRVLRPIPKLASLSDLERIQAQIIAKDVADLAKPRAIAQRHRPSVFISRLEGLAATEILFDEKLPHDLFPLLKEELRDLHVKMPSAAQLTFGLFTFGATFTRLLTPSEKFRDVAVDKQAALLNWGQEKQQEIFLYAYHYVGDAKKAYGRTSAYAWDGTQLKLVQKKVGAWGA